MVARVSLAFFAVAFGCAFAACGGGGGGSAPPTGGSGSQSVSGSGILVDHESGSPLPNEPVALASWSPGAAAISQGVTGSDGSFSVHASLPGEYLLVIGSDSATDTTRPTIHDAITLTSPSQTLVAPTMPAVPDETPNPIEQSGNFRLTTLTSAEAGCLTYENQVRATYSYAPVVSDEWLTENNRMNWIYASEHASSGAAGSTLTNYNGGSGGQDDCEDMITFDHSAGDSMASSGLSWYSGDAGQVVGGAAQESLEEGMFDPRGPLPTPTPSSPWP